MKQRDDTKKKGFAFFILLTLSFFLVLSFATIATAHRVVLFAWIQGDTIFTESQFPNGKKISNADIAVYDRDEALLISGKSDALGKFSFKIPLRDYLKIVLDAGTGHQAKWIFCEKDIKASCPSDIDTRVVKFKSPYNKQTTRPKSKPDVDAKAIHTDTPALKKACPEAQKMERIIGKVLDKKLQPIMGMLVKMQDSGPTATDVFGGIGYILGIMGIAAFFYSRKK